MFEDLSGLEKSDILNGMRVPTALVEVRAVVNTLGFAWKSNSRRESTLLCEVGLDAPVAVSREMA